MRVGMDNEDAIRVVKQAILWCHMRDMPKTKASMADLLETLIDDHSVTVQPSLTTRLLH